MSTLYSRFTLTTVFLLGVTGCDGLFGTNTCDGWYWCEGDKLMECYETSHGSSYGEVLTDCSQAYGTTCNEVENPSGETEAGCVLSGANCNSGNPYVCVENTIALCDDDGMAIESNVCGGYGEGDYCIESDFLNQAVCAYDTGLCETGGEQKCLEDGSGYVTCEGDVWLAIEQCEDCIEWTDDDGVQKAGCRMSSVPCPESDDYMCFGNIVASCTETGFPVEIEECFLEQQCVLSELDSGNPICAYSDEPCVAGETFVCGGDNIATCEETGYPTYYESCSAYCVMSDGEPHCTYDEGHCEDGEQKCASDNVILICVDGVWGEREWCSHPDTCVELQDGTAECS